MVASNLTPYALAGVSPDWFRFYGTFAAPLFVFLAGMMVSLTGIMRNHTLMYFVKRGVLVIGVGACIDAYIWGLVPFLTMDVLYLIGLAMPLTYVTGKIHPVWRCVLIAAIFAATPYLQEGIGYRYAPEAFMLASEAPLMEFICQTPLWQSWLVDGWFPVFPWLGVALAGHLAGEARLHYRSFDTNAVLASGLCSLMAGAYWWQLEPIKRFAREGYPDLFYPPTLSFFLIAAGVIMLLFYFVDRSSASSFYTPFSLYGRCSLLMYVLHSYVIGDYFLPQRQKGVLHSFDKFLLVYLGFMGALLVVAWCASLIRSTGSRRRKVRSDS